MEDKIYEIVTDLLRDDLTKIEAIEKLLDLFVVVNCNGVKDPNFVKMYALINRKDGLIDVWCEGECLGKGLDTDGINKLNLQ